MKRPTTKSMQAVARQEIAEWTNLPNGLVMAILFAFVHRYTTGETVEETFFKTTTAIPDYEI